MQKRKMNQVLTYVDLCKWLCRRGREGAVLNVRASKLSLTLSLEKVEHWYFSSRSKLLSCNLFSSISQIHHYCQMDLAKLLLRKSMGLTPLLGTDPHLFPHRYHGGWTQVYTKQHFHIPHLAQPSWCGDGHLIFTATLSFFPATFACGAREGLWASDIRVTLGHWLWS